MDQRGLHRMGKPLFTALPFPEAGASFIKQDRIAPSPGHSVLENAEIASISRTGEMLILMPGEKRILSQVPLTGGSPRELAEQIYGADWSPDGSTMAISRSANGRSYLEFPPGKVVYESTKEIGPIRVSAAGNSVAFVEHDAGASNGIVVVFDEQRQEDYTIERIVPGWNLLGTDRTKKSGSQRSQTTQVADMNCMLSICRAATRLIQRFPGGTALLDVASDGRALIVFTDQRTILMFHAQDQEERELSWLDNTQVVDFSQDGKTDSDVGAWRRKRISQWNDFSARNRWFSGCQTRRRSA